MIFLVIGLVYFLEKDLKVMDSTATALCRDNNIPLLVFGIADPENIVRAVKGEHIGTLVKWPKRTVPIGHSPRFGRRNFEKILDDDERNSPRFGRRNFEKNFGWRWTSKASERKKKLWITQI